MRYSVRDHEGTSGRWDVQPKIMADAIPAFCLLADEEQPSIATYHAKERREQRRILVNLIWARCHGCGLWEAFRAGDDCRIDAQLA